MKTLSFTLPIYIKRKVPKDKIWEVEILHYELEVQRLSLLSFISWETQSSSL